MMNLSGGPDGSDTGKFSDFDEANDVSVESSGLNDTGLSAFQGLEAAEETVEVANESVEQGLEMEDAPLAPAKEAEVVEEDASTADVSDDESEFVTVRPNNNPETLVSPEIEGQTIRREDIEGGSSLEPPEGYRPGLERY